MKEWVRTHPYLTLAVGYLLLFIVYAGLWLAFTAGDLEEAVFNAAMWTLAYWLLAFFQTRRRRRTKARLDERGQTMAYIRYPESRAGSLSSIWNQGIATPGAGSIHFQPAVYDTLEPSGRAINMKVYDVLPQRRKLTGKDRRYIQVAGIQALTLVTDGGKVEIAASPESLDKLSEVPGCRGAATGGGS